MRNGGSRKETSQRGVPRTVAFIVRGCDHQSWWVEKGVFALRKDDGDLEKNDKVTGEELKW